MAFLYPMLVSGETDCANLHEALAMGKPLSTGDTGSLCQAILQQADTLKKNDSLISAVKSVKATGMSYQLTLFSICADLCGFVW